MIAPSSTAGAPETDGLQSRRLWSLWEMLEVNIGFLVDDIAYLRAQLEIAEQHPDQSEDMSVESMQIFIQACERLPEFLERMDLKASSRAIERLLLNLEHGDAFTRSDLNRFGHDLLLRMVDELELTKFVAVESNKVGLYEPKGPLFGESTSTHYPSAYFEIEEAGKCLALGRSTACVFHLMRALEVGIRAVASNLKIPDPVKPTQRNWGAILKSIKDEISNRARWSRKANKLFFEEVYASLDSVKNPWRNATMHVEQTYTEEEAESIFYAVRSFMTKISSRFDENGRFVA